MGVYLQHWFLEGLLIAIALAAVWPNLGKKRALLERVLYIRKKLELSSVEYSVKYGAVALIFIISGISLKSKVLMKSLADWKMHLVIQAISLGVTPAIGLALGRLLGLSSFNSTLIKGMIIACSTPTTISSNVLMTKQANGNEAAALTNAVIGNILGVFISPSLIMTYVGNVSSSKSLDFKQTFIDLTITVVAPLILGQIIQLVFPKFVTLISKYISLPITNSCLLLVLVWSVFCDTFADNVGSLVDPGSMVAILFINLGLFIGFSALAFGVSRIPFFGFSRADTIAIVMCAATKTVALGIPMINIIYEGSPLIGILSAPLLIYHAEQLVVGSFMVDRFKIWVNKDQ
ncbi:putative sodium bile acid cotransporter [Chytridium lagenaria]|nr:putative sodium bile acid cotransporter [Chytridium lagenaria]